MKELTIVANKYSTDKGTELYRPQAENEVVIHGKLCHHGYTEFYDQYFSQYKTTRPTILEIGTAEGGSIKMYNEYYHGNCEIYCLDVRPECKSIESLGDNIHFYVCDQSNPQSLQEFVNMLNVNNIKFDFIVDDGSHVSEHIMLTYNYLHDYIKKDGFYIIEDLQVTVNTEKEKSPIYFFTEFKNFHIFNQETNDRLHEGVKSAILFTNKNKYREQNDDLAGMTLLIKMSDYEQVSKESDIQRGGRT